ncbi:hypothetical protein AB840_10390 [Megasphaera cerevisiae DSM 20462]|uniref:Uncharacterized protein n=1 Tax=Megasphaera cerevisiae DSM 20462 TaxID=1122219 RepID=A0A0J6WTX8_9FIRM|nr:hypothetical protein [Megasphaera cerevisiae]KMO85989.1 hypothetical protein AB840_10390 [Megasphaera cerevisiae DSM 20462]
MEPYAFSINRISLRIGKVPAAHRDNRIMLMGCPCPRPFVGASIHGARKQEPVQSGPCTWVFHIAGPGYLLIPGSLLFIRSMSAVSYRPCVTSFLQGPHHFLKRDREIGPFLLNSLVGTESKK